MRTTTRRTLRPTAVALVVGAMAIVGILVCQSASSSATTTATIAATAASDVRYGVIPDTDGVVTVADGSVPDGVTVFDGGYPAVTNLDRGLLDAVRAAAVDAAATGVEFQVNSGWRSPDYQNQLRREAVVTYGSEAEALRWVATAETSAHVAGTAVDIGSVDATAWLSAHGAAYGLCQIYANESWHYELRPQAVDHGCPAMYADPTHDPRMQQ